jgi:hypothetical protein
VIDQSLVQSGFDAEILMGSRYLRYLLLSSVETGTFPTRIAIADPALDITIHPPEDYQRLYQPNALAEPLPTPDARAFETAILFDQPSGADLRIRMITDLRERQTGNQITGQFVDLFVTLTLETQLDGQGIPREPRLRLAVVDLGLDGSLLLALAFAGMTKEDLLPLIKDQVDRSIDLGVVGAGQNLQAIEMQKLGADGEHPGALGVYLDLRLRSGPAPTAFLGDRGDLANARNFLPEGDDLAFGMAGALYSRLGDDALFRMAQETAAGSGEYHYPLRADPNNPESEQKGKIKNITVSALAGNVLRIDVHGEFFVDWLPDPDFHFTFDVTPVVENGLLTFSITNDIDVDLLGSLLVGLVLVGLVLGIGAASIAALLVLGAQELIVEPIALSQVRDKAGAFDASFLDALPHRVAAERRRWDPFYTTEHQIVALLDAVQITSAGIGFSGRAALDKEPDPTDHVVIRDEARGDDGAVTELWYRVRDIDQIGPDLERAFLATDRRPYARVEGDAEPNLLRLTMDQVRSRLGEARLLESIAYVPKKVYVRDGQIRLLLCISETELDEVRAQTPPEQLDAALDPLLRFDLDSPELLVLEDDRVLFLRGYERIRMVRKGRVSRYYRDRPDFNPSDNLLSLPRYRPATV